MPHQMMTGRISIDMIIYPISVEIRCKWFMTFRFPHLSKTIRFKLFVAVEFIMNFHNQKRFGFSWFNSFSQWFNLTSVTTKSRDITISSNERTYKMINSPNRLDLFDTFDSLCLVGVLHSNTVLHSMLCGWLQVIPAHRFVRACFRYDITIWLKWFGIHKKSECMPMLDILKMATICGIA